MVLFVDVQTRSRSLGELASVPRAYFAWWQAGGVYSPSGRHYTEACGLWENNTSSGRKIPITSQNYYGNIQGVYKGIPWFKVILVHSEVKIIVIKPIYY